ncbi:MAG: hypothetical protein R3F19_14540 [Verrucomicrobiales bacterium]
MSYESSSFSRSSSSSSQEGGRPGERRRKVRKKRRKTMTADDMRKGVTFQTGLTGKAKLALFGAILAAIAITVVVMMAVNGSFSFKTLPTSDSPSLNNDGFGLDAFDTDSGSGLPAAPAGDDAPGNAPAPQPTDDLSNVFQE